MCLQCKRLEFDPWVRKKPWRRERLPTAVFWPTVRRPHQSILKEISPEYSLEDAKAETLILWLPDVKNWLIVRDPDAGEDWRWEEKGITKDEMVGWHHWCDGHEFEQPLAVDDGWGRLAVLGSMGLKKSDTTEWLNWTEAELRLNDYRVINMQMRTILISELTGK